MVSVRFGSVFLPRADTKISVAVCRCIPDDSFIINQFVLSYFPGARTEKNPYRCRLRAKIIFWLGTPKDVKSIWLFEL